MFYGCMVPEEVQEGDLDDERLIVSREASLWLQDDGTCGVKRINRTNLKTFFEDLFDFQHELQKGKSDVNSLFLIISDHQLPAINRLDLMEVYTSPKSRHLW